MTDDPSPPAGDRGGATRPRTVLFVHGLESGPRGRKARALAAAGFDVVSEQMPCGRSAVARDPVVVAAVAAGVAGVALATWLGGGVGLALGTFAALGLARVASPLVVRRAFRRSVEVQRRALARSKIDVVVGSSFGGAVALALLHEGSWRGPTVLLCPAHELVAGRARQRPPPPLAALPDASRILVVHGRRDETVPLASSEALVTGSSARLIACDDDHRLASTATPARFSAWIAAAIGGQIPSV